MLYPDGRDADRNLGRKSESWNENQNADENGLEFLIHVITIRRPDAVAGQGGLKVKRVDCKKFQISSLDPSPHGAVNVYVLDTV
jgi:hypothetical protein